MTELVQTLAVRQLADYRAGTPGSWFGLRDRPELSMDDAYAVQAGVTALRAPDERVAGYKVGCTGPGTRAQFGLDGPIRGVLYDSELHSSGVQLPHGSYANLAIEGELAVWLDDDAQITRVLPVVELHNYVFRGRPPTLPELVSNNGLHAGVVLPDSPGAVWRRDEPLSGRLAVEINGAVVDEGPVAGVPGGPAGSVQWLRRHLAEYGRSLQPGQLVLTGTPLGLIPVRPGDHVRVIAEHLGSVEASVVA